MCADRIDGSNCSPLSLRRSIKSFFSLFFPSCRLRLSAPFTFYDPQALIFHRLLFRYYFFFNMYPFTLRLSPGSLSFVLLITISITVPWSTVRVLCSGGKSVQIRLGQLAFQWLLVDWTDWNGCVPPNWPPPCGDAEQQLSSEAIGNSATPSRRWNCPRAYWLTINRKRKGERQTRMRKQAKTKSHSIQ